MQTQYVFVRRYWCLLLYTRHKYYNLCSIQMAHPKMLRNLTVNLGTKCNVICKTFNGI